MNRNTYSLYSAAVVVLFLLRIVVCSSDNSTAPETKSQDTSNRMIVLHDSSITEPSWSLFFFRLTWAYYATPDDVLTDTILIDLGAAKTFDVLMLREVIELAIVLSNGALIIHRITPHSPHFLPTNNQSGTNGSKNSTR